MVKQADSEHAQIRTFSVWIFCHDGNKAHSHRHLRLALRPLEGPALSEVPGFGVKTQQKITEGLDHVAEKEERLKLVTAEHIASSMVDYLNRGKGVKEITVAGSFRRRKETVGDLDFQELVVVSDRFHVKPLLPIFIADGRFYILALSQNEVRLLQGTRYSSREIALEGVPGNLAEALRFDDPEKQLQFHTGTPAGKGKRPAMFHGHGVGTDDSKVNLLRYFRHVDRGLHEILRDEEAPLVVASVDYLLPIYREANTCPHLVEEGVEGNPEGLGAEELHGRAWGIIEPYFEKAQEDAVALYRQFAGTGRTSTDIKEIAPAAYHGRVEFLFVALGLQQWGAFDPNRNTVMLHEEQEPGDEDLLDMAAVHTFLKGGRVYAVQPDKVPDGRPSAALFRY